MELDTISISTFNKGNGLKTLNDNLLISDNIEHVEELRHPCRLDAITILVCTDGELDCRVNLHDYSVKANNMMVNFPENILQVGSMRNFCGYVLLISTEYINKLQIDIKKKVDSYINLKENPFFSASSEDVANIQGFYELINYNLDIECPEREDILRGLLISLVFKIISIINSKRPDVPLLNDESNIQQYFERFMNLLLTYHSSERSLKFYADKLNITTNYLSCMVKSYSGHSASYWLHEYVILEAKALLKMPGMSIKQVTYRLHFSSQSIFGKYFKKRTGMSPKEYVKGN